jgi:hypothetical protein
MDRTAARETWQKRVERWNDSGLTAGEFAGELGISERSLRWWKWRLGSESANPTRGSSKRRRPRSSSTPSPTVTFVEVPQVAPAAAPIEIVLRSRVEVRVAAGFDGPTLERVLEILERRS